MKKWFVTNYKKEIIASDASELEAKTISRKNNQRQSLKKTQKTS